MMEIKPEVFLLDVDGVLTNGQFFYTEAGKVMKIFGPDDNDALSLLQPWLHIHFVTGDRKGFAITKKRVVDDMGFDLDLVSTIRRIEWIKEKWNPKQVIYMGDGIFDHYVFKEVGYSIAPANADENAKKTADFLTRRTGGERAVSEACLHILAKFFKPFDPERLPVESIKMSKEWTV